MATTLDLPRGVTRYAEEMEIDAEHDGRTVQVWQLVASNLSRARERASITQQEFSDLFNLVTGAKWTRATVSQAESGWSESPSRIRQFDVNELFAFALILDVPVTYFFEVPLTMPNGKDPVSPTVTFISVNPRTKQGLISKRDMDDLCPGTPVPERQPRSRWPSHLGEPDPERRRYSPLAKDPRKLRELLREGETSRDR